MLVSARVAGVTRCRPKNVPMSGDAAGGVPWASACATSYPTEGGEKCARVWWREARWRRPMWRFAAALPGMLVLFLFCTLMPSSPPVRKPAVQAAAQELHMALPVAKRMRPARPLPAAAAEEPDPLMEPFERLAGYSPPVQDRLAGVAAPPENPERTESQPPAGDARSPTAFRLSPTPTEKGPYRLTGDWFFVPTAETTKSGYQPEFIELRLSEDGGMVRGRYRARYRVTDRAISPSVAFQFEGRTAAEGGVLPWRGTGGAQGEITLHLLANGNLEVEWAAAQLGEELGLIAGTATLVRKLE